MLVRWQITGGKNCRFAEAVPLKIFLHQRVASKNRLSPQIDKNVETPFQCLFAAFAIRSDQRNLRTLRKAIFCFPGKPPISLFHSVGMGTRNVATLSGVAAGKEIVDF